MRVDTLSGMTALFVVCGVAFSITERLWPERARAPYFSRSRLVDWIYWPFSAFFTGNLTRVATFGAVAVVALAFERHGVNGDLYDWLVTRSSSGLARFGLGTEVLVALLVGDLVNYWNHRLRHTRWLWPFHAVHHGPTSLDWLASVRMHPVDDLVDNVTVGLVLLGIGTSPAVWLGTGPFLFFFNAWIHANVPWRLGWMRYVVATPAFHRWHHAAESAKRGCNFSGVFPIWDLVFGTFWLPDHPPIAFGPGSTDVPKSFFGQLAFPFREIIRRATTE